MLEIPTTDLLVHDPAHAISIIHCRWVHFLNRISSRALVFVMLGTVGGFLSFVATRRNCFVGSAHELIARFGE